MSLLLAKIMKKKRGSKIYMRNVPIYISKGEIYFYTLIGMNTSLFSLTIFANDQKSWAYGHFLLFSGELK